MLTATAVIPRSDLARLVASMTPFRLTLAEEWGCVVTLDRPTVELVPDQGIRLRGTGAVTWKIAHAPIPVRVNAWQLLLEPRIEARAGSHVLALEPYLEDLELKAVPGLVDENIAAAVSRVITRHQHGIAWNFGRALAARLPLPARVSPTSTFAIFPVGGETSVSDREVQLVLSFEARFEVEQRAEQAATAGAEAQPSGTEMAMARAESGTRAAPPQARPQMGHFPRKRLPPARSRTWRLPPAPRTRA
jgi:hypothetical protein